MTGSTNTSVNWSATAGTISSSGLYTAPTSAGTYTVTATSIADSTKSAPCVAGWQDQHKVTDSSSNSIGGAAVITPSWIVSTTVKEYDRTAQWRRKGAHQAANGPVRDVE